MDSEVLIERLEPLAQADALTRSEALPAALPLALLTAGVLVVAWLLVAPDSPDLAAQVYRVRLFEHGGFAVWDDNWYGGHNLPGYSLLFPWLASLLGMRLVGVLAVVASTWGFERLVVPVYGARARWAAVCFAVAAAGDLWIGRLTFALGVTLAVLDGLALARGRAGAAAALAALCAASSPVAGVLLGLAGLTYALAERRPQGGLMLAVPALVVVGAMQALFPEGGWEPFAASSVAATLAVTLAFWWALPSSERVLRIGAGLYVPVVLGSLIHTPMGSNVDRYAALLGAPLLVAGLARGGSSGRGRPLVGVVAVVAGILVWTVWGPVRETRGVAGDPSTKAAYYAPLERFLAAHGGQRVRVEVPFTHSHWEAALLAPRVELARGWERQLDTRYDGLFFGGRLTAGAYRRWLHEEGVSLVALPDVRLDTSARAEGALVRRGLPYLREVFRSAHWRVFAVRDPTPLVSVPARLAALDHDSLRLVFTRAGTALVRVRYTRYWTVSGGAACVVGEAPDGWTLVHAWGPGQVSVAARFSWARALGEAQCRRPASRGASPNRPV